MDSASSRDCLHGGYALLGEGWGVRAEHDARCGGGEVWETCDWKVFVVECGVISEDLVGLGSNQLVNAA